MSFQLAIKNFPKKYLWISAVLITGIFIGLYWRHSVIYPSTDDAYVNANIINIAAQVSGPVAQIYVQDHQFVKKGQLLFTIDQRSFQLALDQAKAELKLSSQNVAAAVDQVAIMQSLLKQRQAKLIATEKNSQRILVLVKKGLLPKANGDDATAALQEDRAAVAQAQSQLQQARQQLGDLGKANPQIQAAEAQLGQAQLNLQYTEVRAPADGILINFSLRVGSTVNANQPLFALIENSSWWIDANFKETDLTRIKVGQPAAIKIDIYSDQKFKGVVNAVSAGSGSVFSLLPPENATGNWVKVTQRFPVKILLINPNPKYPLRVGASSNVTIDTN